MKPGTPAGKAHTGPEIAVAHKTLCGILIAAALSALHANGQTNGPDLAPRRIVLNLTASPATSMAVTWRTNALAPRPAVQVAEAGDWTDFAGGARTVGVRTEKVTLEGATTVYHHSATLAGLRPNTLYAYRVGADSAWSEWNQFSTARSEAAPFEFVFFGDPQNGIADVMSRVFMESLLRAPRAKFWLFTGDLMELPQYDRLWTEWFSAIGPIPSVMPSTMSPGSHEYALKTKKETRWDVLTPLWRAHFTLPENGPRGLEERAYVVDYQGVRFIMLDAQWELREQSEWLDKVLADNPNRWTVAAMHEPVFSVADKRDGHATRDAFMGLFDKYGVDLVLSGHDHVYSRSHKLRQGAVVPDTGRGTVYVTSMSGAKSYTMGHRYSGLMQTMGEKVQLYQVIALNSRALTYTAYTATGRVYDAFELSK